MTWERRLEATCRPSRIVGGEGALRVLSDEARALTDARRRCFVITDRNVEGFWGDEIRAALGGAIEGTIVLEPGETSKSLSVAGRVYDILAQAGARRDDVVVALGGGVVGDLAGFVAATYHRGIGLWQVPTSLLAQVDSSAGGKVGINLSAGKNLVGCFYQPELVIIEPRLLHTLPQEEVVNGLGEVAKYALLGGEAVFGTIEAEAGRLYRLAEDALAAAVHDCVVYKADVVEADERESGRRAVLNLGHTTAHALEALSGYRGLAHGKAVAVGLLVALAVSEELYGLDPAVRERTRRLLLEFELPVALPTADVLAIIEAMAADKKTSAEGRGFVTLRALGEPEWGVDVSDDVLRQALEVVS